ncbi:MAG TPA: hypothetical protein VHP33_23590 [Polyangiaceae bacterium]|nr:hypothetical protein [Polyangiaceae bacterium]
MPAWFRSIQEAYFRLDRRVLGVFRVGLGLVLLYDLLRRWPDAALLWSNEGVLTNAALRKVPQAAHQTSFFFSLASAGAVEWAFAGLALVFVLYGLGLFTRVMQVLALLGYASLNARNLFFEDGGTGTVILLLTWTLLLPLADRFSLDALRRDAALSTIKARVAARAEARTPVYSLAALAILLQASVIYWLNAVHKSGQTWRLGDAVHLVFWQHRVNTPLAVWFSAHEPRWFSPLACWLTKRTEFILPVLLLWPSHPLQSRAAAFVLAVLLHGGIAACLTLGPFSYAMICLVWLAVPGAAWDWLAARLPSLSPAKLWRLRRYRARVVWALRRRLGSAAARRPLSSPWQARLFRLREALLVWMLVVETGSVLSSNRAIPKQLKVDPGPWIDGYKPYLRGFQGWSMFAPDAPREDGTMVVDAVTADGRHLDPFTGLAPDFEGVRSGLTPHSIALSDYFFAMKDSRNARYRTDLARYLRSLPRAKPGDRLRSAEFWWVSYVPPPRGQYVAGPIKRQKLWKAKL